MCAQGYLWVGMGVLAWMRFGVSMLFLFCSRSVTRRFPSGDEILLLVAPTGPCPPVPVFYRKVPPAIPRGYLGNCVSLCHPPSLKLHQPAPDAPKLPVNSSWRVLASFISTKPEVSHIQACDAELPCSGTCPVPGYLRNLDCVHCSPYFTRCRRPHMLHPDRDDF